MRRVYADHAATTAPVPEVVAGMLPYLGEAFGNASSVHTRGEAARDAIEAARAHVAALIGTMPEEIVFTATGSEANNLAVAGLMHAAEGNRKRVVVSAIEHPSVLETARALEAEGFALTIVPVRPNGIVEPGDLEAALGDGNDVALVSILWVNNETGVIQPIAQLADVAHAAGAKFHVDAVQAAGKLPVNVLAVGVDLLSLAAHKLHGPLGAAALYVKRRVRLAPLIHGGHQERARRAGTENLPAIVGFGIAVERAARMLAAGESERVTALGERLLAGLLKAVPDTTLNGDLNRRAGGFLNLCFHGVDGEAVLHELDRAGVIVSTGSACSAASPGPSHVLLAMGLRPEDAHASVRFSLGEANSEADIDTILEVMPPIVERLRALDRPALERSA